MKIATTTLSIVAVLCFLLACSKQKNPQRDLVLETANSLEEITDRKLAEGRKVYGKYCSVCHGLEGRGDGFNAYNLDPKPRNFADPDYRARMDSTLIAETIISGGAAMGLSPLMPAWGRTLSKAYIKNACYYVLYLSRTVE
jgi:mono/diheme cytochrome c family protein